ncbi:MAG: hypothetical protein AB7S41_16970 [Parvibaculaceae bacterium]
MSRARRWAATGLVLTLLSGSAAWAAELGRTQFQGKTIILSDDNTWRFDETAQTETKTEEKTADCADGVKVTSKSLPVSLCFGNAVWDRDNPTGAWEVMFRNKEGTLYGGLITETVALEESFLRNAILQNASAFAKIDISKVRIDQEEKADVNGKSWNHIVYGVPIGGAGFTFSNYYMTIPNTGMVQVVFFSPDSSFKPSQVEIDKVVGTLSLGGGAGGN